MCAVASGGLEEQLNEWFRLFDETSTLVRRLDAPEFDYLTEVAENEPLLILRDKVRQLMAVTFERCREYRGKYEEYNYLWKVRVAFSFYGFGGPCD